MKVPIRVQRQWACFYKKYNCRISWGTCTKQTLSKVMRMLGWWILKQTLYVVECMLSSLFFSETDNEIQTL